MLRILRKVEKFLNSIEDAVSRGMELRLKGFPLLALCNVSQNISAKYVMFKFFELRVNGKALYESDELLRRLFGSQMPLVGGIYFLDDAHTMMTNLLRCIEVRYLRKLAKQMRRERGIRKNMRRREKLRRMSRSLRRVCMVLRLAAARRRLFKDRVLKLAYRAFQLASRWIGALYERMHKPDVPAIFDAVGCHLDDDAWERARALV
jgi:hypothetical protein